MTIEKCKKTTYEYYENWLGESGCLSVNETSKFIYSNERNVKQLGYPSQSDLYVWLQRDRLVVSYGDAAKPKIWELKVKISDNRDISAISSAISEVYDCKVKHNIKYLFDRQSLQTKADAKTLSTNDYSDYEKFFLRCFPGDTDDWLKEYFDGMVKQGYCVGVYVDGIVVSCTDAPSMPYIADKVQEIGVNTLPDYRGKGLAAIVCEKAAENILLRGKVPQWSTTIDNIASQKLAERVGFVKLADVFTVTL